ncbi:MAG: ABC transporter permease [Oscillospiraceae bacterium]
MTMFLANLKNELQKLFSKKKYMVFIIISIAIALGNVGIKLLVNKVAQGNFALSTHNISYSMLSFIADFMVPLIVFMAATDLFSSEFQDDSIKAILVRPISRFKIYLSKIMAIFVLAAVNFVCMLVVTAGLEIISGNGGVLRNVIMAYLLDMIPMFVVILMATAVNQLGKSSTMALFLCIIVYAALAIGGIFIPHLSGLLFTGYMKWHNIWLGTALPFSAMISKIALMFGYGLIFLSGGYYLFARRSL